MFYRFVAFALLLCSIAFATPKLFASNETKPDSANEVQKKVLYLNYVELPKRLIKGELFSVTIRTLSVIKDFEDIEYRLFNAKDVQILNGGIPYRQEKEHAFYDTFWFRATGTHVKLPDIEATLVDYFATPYRKTILRGKRIETIKLNPRKDFCNIIAKDFVIKNYKTTTYDDTHNIVVFVAQAKETFLKDFHLPHAISQGFESLNDNIDLSRMIYYAVIDKKIENLLFSYFNLEKNDFVTLGIPIIVQEDRVATQSDLKPKDNSKKRFKLFAAAGVIFLGVVLLLWRGRYIYIALIVLPAFYIFYLLIPQEKICIKENTKIKILPLENGTVFEITKHPVKLTKIGETKGYVKIELPNKKIGWISNEDLCAR